MSTPFDASFGSKGAAERLMRVEKDLYTPEEIAEVLDTVTVEQVRAAVFRGDLPAVRDERDHIVGVHRADFLRWLGDA